MCNVETSSVRDLGSEKCRQEERRLMAVKDRIYYKVSVVRVRGQIVNIARLRALGREEPVMVRLFIIRNMAQSRKYDIIQINKTLQHHPQQKVRESSLSVKDFELS